MGQRIRVSPTCVLDGDAFCGDAQAHGAVFVGAVDVGDGGVELGERGCRGVAVGVALADLDARVPRVRAGEERGQPGVLAAVVGDLEQLYGTKRQPTRDLGLGIAG